MSEETTARTKLDLLFQETLGDVAGLIERTERVNDKLRETATALLAGIEAFSAANAAATRLARGSGQHPWGRARSRQHGSDRSSGA